MSNFLPAIDAYNFNFKINFTDDSVTVIIRYYNLQQFKKNHSYYANGPQSNNG